MRTNTEIERMKERLDRQQGQIDLLISEMQQAKRIIGQLVDTVEQTVRALVVR